MALFRKIIIHVFLETYGLLYCYCLGVLHVALLGWRAPYVVLKNKSRLATCKVDALPAVLSLV